MKLFSFGHDVGLSPEGEKKLEAMLAPALAEARGTSKPTAPAPKPTVVAPSKASQEENEFIKRTVPAFKSGKKLPLSDLKRLRSLLATRFGKEASKEIASIDAAIITASRPPAPKPAVAKAPPAPSQEENEFIKRTVPAFKSGKKLPLADLKRLRSLLASRFGKEAAKEIANVDAAIAAASRPPTKPEAVAKAPTPPPKKAPPHIVIKEPVTITATKPPVKEAPKVAAKIPPPPPGLSESYWKSVLPPPPGISVTEWGRYLSFNNTLIKTGTLPPASDLAFMVDIARRAGSKVNPATLATLDYLKRKDSLSMDELVVAQNLSKKQPKVSAVFTTQMVAVANRTSTLDDLSRAHKAALAAGMTKTAIALGTKIKARTPTATIATAPAPIPTPSKKIPPPPPGVTQANWERYTSLVSGAKTTPVNKLNQFMFEDDYIFATRLAQQIRDKNNGQMFARLFAETHNGVSLGDYQRMIAVDNAIKSKRPVKVADIRNAKIIADKLGSAGVSARLAMTLKDMEVIAMSESAPKPSPPSGPTRPTPTPPTVEPLILPTGLSATQIADLLVNRKRVHGYTIPPRWGTTGHNIPLGKGDWEFFNVVATRLARNESITKNELKRAYEISNKLGWTGTSSMLAMEIAKRSPEKKTPPKPGDVIVKGPPPTPSETQKAAESYNTDPKLVKKLEKEMRRNRRLREKVEALTADVQRASAGHEETRVKLNELSTKGTEMERAMLALATAKQEAADRTIAATPTSPASAPGIPVMAPGTITAPTAPPPSAPAVDRSAQTMNVPGPMVTDTIAQAQQGQDPVTQAEIEEAARDLQLASEGDLGASTRINAAREGAKRKDPNAMKKAAVYAAAGAMIGAVAAKVATNKAQAKEPMPSVATATDIEAPKAQIAPGKAGGAGIAAVILGLGVAGLGMVALGKKK